MYEALRQRLFDVLEVAAPTDRFSKVVHLSLDALIILNILAVILETVDALAGRYGLLFEQFDNSSVAIFTVEYCLRLWVCTKNGRYRGPIWGRVRFALTPLAIIDLLVLLPFYLPLFFRFDLRVMRALRLIRLVRILKMHRYSRTMSLFGRILYNKKEELLVSASMMMLVLLFASFGIYLLEKVAQPDAFSSIPAAMWWAIVTLTTVGYGDIYPVTPLGKVLGSGIALLGIGVFALPAGILASGLYDVLSSHDQVSKVDICPHCGAVIDDLMPPVDSE